MPPIALKCCCSTSGFRFVAKWSITLLNSVKYFLPAISYRLSTQRTNALCASRVLTVQFSRCPRLSFLSLWKCFELGSWRGVRGRCVRPEAVEMARQEYYPTPFSVNLRLSLGHALLQHVLLVHSCHRV